MRRDRRPDELRPVEIQRLIGRAIRAVADFQALGERTLWLDCDVLQADGGTRTAAITGAYVALADAIGWLGERGKLAKPGAIVNSIAAVSVGVIDGEPRLDLAYEEDARAGTDMNVVCTGDGGFVYVQGTAEDGVFDRGTLDALLDLDYTEDVSAGTDMNVVVTGDGRFVEVQGTAEGAPFDRSELEVLLSLAERGCAELTRLQSEALQGAGVR